MQAAQLVVTGEAGTYLASWPAGLGNEHRRIGIKHSLDFIFQLNGSTEQPADEWFSFPTSPHRKSSKHGIQDIFTHKKIHITQTVNCIDLTSQREAKAATCS